MPLKPTFIKGIKRLNILCAYFYHRSSLALPKVGQKHVIQIFANTFCFLQPDGFGWLVEDTVSFRVSLTFTTLCKVPVFLDLLFLVGDAIPDGKRFISMPSNLIGVRAFLLVSVSMLLLLSSPVLSLLD